MPLPSIRVKIDVNEKTGFKVQFPPKMFSTHTGERRLYRVEQIPVRLKEGDYAIDGYEGLGCVDTKRSLDELRKNLFDTDKERAGKALRRLAANCRYPYLMLDMTPAEFARPNERCKWPDVVHDAVFKELGALGINLLWLPAGKTPYARQQTGEFMLRILLGHIAAERETTNGPPKTLTANNFVTSVSASSSRRPPLRAKRSSDLHAGGDTPRPDCNPPERGG